MGILTEQRFHTLRQRNLNTRKDYKLLEASLKAVFLSSIHMILREEIFDQFSCYLSSVVFIKAATSGPNSDTESQTHNRGLKSGTILGMYRGQCFTEYRVPSNKTVFCRIWVPSNGLPI